VVDRVGVLEAVRAAIAVAQASSERRVKRRRANLGRQLHHVVQADDRRNLHHDHRRATDVRIVGVTIGSARPASISTTARRSLTSCSGSNVAFKEQDPTHVVVPPWLAQAPTRGVDHRRGRGGALEAGPFTVTIESASRRRRELAGTAGGATRRGPQSPTGSRQSPARSRDGEEVAPESRRPQRFTIAPRHPDERRAEDRTVGAQTGRPDLEMFGVGMVAIARADLLATSKNSSPNPSATDPAM
jgi:hypothetical protein